MELQHFESLYPEDTRKEEVEKLLQFVKKGSSCQCVSIPGAGRSSLLGLLSYNKNVRVKHLGKNEKDFHFVYLSFSEIRKRPLSDAYKFIFLNLVDSLKERGLIQEFETTNKIFKDSIQIKDEMVIFSGLKKTIDYLCLEKNLTVVLLFDRFDDYIGTLESEFFANLRILRNRAKYKFGVIFSINRPLEEVLEPVFFSDFYEFVAGNIVYLNIFDKAGLDFRINYLEKLSGKKLDRKIYEKLFELTGGHSNLMRLSVESVLATEQIFENKLILRKYLLEQKPIRSALFAILNSLTPSEQLFLSSENSSKTELTYLENSGLFMDGLIKVSLITDYIKDREENPKPQVISLNEAGEITKGEVTISDKFTSLEFKLIKLLISNKNRVLDKEEIINSVWGEQKTTLGVTDQALDQLIFRLRKKIEEDPNSPKLISTIKGRGFKFNN